MRWPSARSAAPTVTASRPSTVVEGSTLDELPTAKGGAFETAEGTVGEIRSYHERRRVRLTWRPGGWDHDTTLQLTVSQAADPAKTRLGIHHEWLADADERERQRVHWQGVVAAIEASL